VSNALVPLIIPVSGVLGFWLIWLAKRIGDGDGLLSLLAFYAGTTLCLFAVGCALLILTI
jgi:hypothetical protein